MARNVVGVDIGMTAIRAVELRNPASSNPTVVRMHQVAVPDGAVRAGEVLEVSAVTAALKSLWREAKFSTRNVALGLGGSVVHPREATFPAAPVARIREMLPFTAQDLIPLPVADAIIDFYPAAESTTDEGQAIRGILVAAAKDATATMVKAVIAAGLNPITVDLKAFGLVRALDSQDAAHESTMIVEIRPSATAIVISVRGVPQFVRLLPTGENDVVHSLAKRLGVTPTQAAHLKTTHGVLAPEGQSDARRVAEAVYASVWDVLVGIRDTLAYFSSAHRQPNPARILLLTDAINTPGLDRLIADTTRIRVERPDFTKLAKTAKSISSGPIPGGEVFIAPLGLAIGAAA